jgi:prepilin-type N-terminal cleavage/methylation domain-containing protein
MKGFTIVELIVSVAIFAVMTALVVAKYGTFNQNTLVTNVAYDMALSIRTAQTYGLSVKSADPSSNAFNSAYGIHFDMSSSKPNKFIFFTDTNKTGVYMGQSEDITTFTLNQNTYISKICMSGDATSCVYTFGAGSPTFLDVTYRRPNPDAVFYTSTDPLNPDLDPVALVTVTSSDGSYNQVVYIRKNGQISVGN